MAPENQSTRGTGLQPNIAGLLCYLLGWITGIIFLIIEKEDKFVKFHAIQSIVVFGAYTIVTILLSYIPVVGDILAGILGVAAFILWIILMYRAYRNEKWKLPVAGTIAEDNSK